MGGHAAVDQQQAGVVLRDEREAVQAQVALALKEAQVLFTQFIQTGPLHSCFLSSIVLGAFARQFMGMLLWQRGGRSQKQKQPHPIKRDEAAGKSSSVVPPKLQEI